MSRHYLGKAHVTPEIICVACGYRHDRASAIDDDSAPAPGDATVCINCGCAMIFTADLNVRLPTAAELKVLGADERFRLVITAQLKAKGDKPT